MDCQCLKHGCIHEAERDRSEMLKITVYGILNVYFHTHTKQGRLTALYNNNLTCNARNLYE